MADDEDTLRNLLDRAQNLAKEGQDRARETFDSAAEYYQSLEAEARERGALDSGGRDQQTREDRSPPGGSETTGQPPESASDEQQAPQQKESQQQEQQPREDRTPPGGSETIQQGQPRESGSDFIMEQQQQQPPEQTRPTTESGIPIGPGGVSEDFDPQEDTLRIDEQGVLDTDPNEITRAEFAFGTGFFDDSGGISPVQKRELAEGVLARNPEFEVGDVVFEKTDGEVTARISREAKEEELTSEFLDQVDGPVNPRNISFEETESGALQLEYNPIYDVGVEKGTGARVNDQGLIVDEPAPGVPADEQQRENQQAAEAFRREFKRRQLREDAAEQFREQTGIESLTKENVTLEQTDSGTQARLDDETVEDFRAGPDTSELPNTEANDVDKLADVEPIGVSGPEQPLQRTQLTTTETVGFDEATSGEDTGVLEGLGETGKGVVSSLPSQAALVAQGSEQTVQGIQEDIVVPLAERSAQGVELTTDLQQALRGGESFESFEEAQETGDIETTGVAQDYESALTGTGRALSYGTVGLPAAGYTVGKTGIEAAEFTVENPQKAPGAAYDVTSQFVQSEAERAQEKPFEFGGEVVGGALIGYGFGKATSPFISGSSRVGTAIRKVDVGTRSFRRLRAESRGLRGADTSDLARSSVVGAQARTQAQRLADIDFDAFIGAERGTLQIGKQTTPDVGDSTKITAQDLDVDRKPFELAEAVRKGRKEAKIQSRRRGEKGEGLTETTPEVDTSPDYEVKTADAGPDAEVKTATRRRGLGEGPSERQRQAFRSSVRSDPDPDLSPRERMLAAQATDVTPDMNLGLVGAQAAAAGTTALLEQAQEPQVTEDTQALPGVQEDTDVMATPTEETTVETETDTRLDPEVVTGVVESEDTGLGRLTITRPITGPRTSLQPTPDIPPDPTPNLTPDLTPGPDPDPDPTPDPTPDITPDPTPDITPDPRPKPDLPALEGDTKKKKERKGALSIEADQFDNEVITPGQALDFEPFNGE